MFKAFGEELNCTNATTKFTGATSGTDTTLTVDAEYKGCSVLKKGVTTLAPVRAAVDMNGCNYKFNQPTIGGIEYHNVAGPPDDITVTIRAIENIEATKEGLCGAGASKRLIYQPPDSDRHLGHDLWIATHGS